MSFLFQGVLVVNSCILLDMTTQNSSIFFQVLKCEYAVRGEIVTLAQVKYQ